MSGQILITGATGNVSTELIKLFEQNQIKVVAAIRNVEKAKQFLPASVELRYFDFQDPASFIDALHGIKKVFLVRPPALSNVKQDIFPFLDTCQAQKVEQIVFLSLLGVEKLAFVPHYKIEQEVVRLGLGYTFLRPSFFMQNLSTTHAAEIRDRQAIYVPAGRGKTSFIDIRDIAQVAYKCLTEAGHLYKAYALTGQSALDYFEVAQIISKTLGRQISYVNPSILSFILCKLREGIPLNFVIVMAAIYGTAKLGKAALVTDQLAQLLGREPITLKDFASDYKSCWQ